MCLAGLFVIYHCCARMTASTGTKRSRATAEQLSHLVDFMAQNDGFAAGKLKNLNGKAENDKKWQELAGLLNSLGGAVKSAEQWNTVWRDLKSRTNVKVRDRKRQQALTGNNALTQGPITELERRVISIIGKSYIEVHDSVLENVPMDETLQLRIEEGEEFVAEMNPSPSAESAYELGSQGTTTPKRTLRRGAKSKRVEKGELQGKFLEIANKQADALKMLAETQSAIAASTNKQADALKILAETQSAIAASTNKQADALKILAETQSAIAASTNKQADALKILAETQSAIAASTNKMSEALEIMGNGLNAVAIAFNNLANSINRLQ